MGKATARENPSTSTGFSRKRTAQAQLRMLGFQATMIRPILKCFNSFTSSLLCYFLSHPNATFYKNGSSAVSMVRVW